MNFLIIMSDEHRKDAMSVLGHPHVLTPNLDRLAANGTLFTNAYTPSPMCVPARAAVACGQNVHQSRYWDSATPYDGKKQSWMKRLRYAGVNVISFGKLHFRSAQDDNGFSDEILPMHVVGEIGWPIGLLRESPPKFESASELAADLGSGDSSYTNYDLAITQAAENWLIDESNHTNPWTAFVSFVSPHYPLRAPEKFYDMYSPDNVNLPVAYDKDQRPDHGEVKNIARFFNYDDYFNESKVRQAIASYYGLCSFMDDCVGRIINALNQSGQLDNTIILYVSDHGEMLGDHGLWTKQVMYEASAGVPMILSGPQIPKSKLTGTASSLLDIYPTSLDIFDLERVDNENQLPGKSLITMANQADDLNRVILSEYHDGGSTTGCFMIRWENWKYIHYVEYPAQLFDLCKDPIELNDLSNSSAHQSIITESRHRLYEMCDPEVVNQQCFKDQSKKIKELGGFGACANAYNFNHTPAPKK